MQVKYLRNICEGVRFYSNVAGQKPLILLKMNSFTAGSSQEFCLDFKLFISIFEILQITYVPELLSMACSALLQNSYFGEHLLVAASVNIYCFHFVE